MRALAEEMNREIEKGRYQSLSEFVSEAIRNKLQAQSFQTTEKMWAHSTSQETFKIGITEHFQSQLKEIVNIQTAKIGEKVSKDEPFGVVETWWFTYDLYPPLNGEIVEANKKVIENPFTLNTDPHQWIVEVKPTH
jgi:glycine cleavage system H protein